MTVVLVVVACMTVIIAAGCSRIIILALRHYDDATTDVDDDASSLVSTTMMTITRCIVPPLPLVSGFVVVQAFTTLPLSCASSSSVSSSRVVSHSSVVVLFDTNYDYHRKNNNTNIVVNKSRHRADDSIITTTTTNTVTTATATTTYQTKWHSMYGVLVNYKHREGHCDVPQNYVTEDYDGGTKKLGGWLHQQRQSYRKGTLDETKKNRLQDLGVMWVLQTSWEEMLLLLLQYKEREGHCNVPQQHIEHNNNNDTNTNQTTKLGKWLSNQRAAKKKGTLPASRARRLYGMGVVWEMYPTTYWEDMYTGLVRYKLREGHCQVPQQYIDAEYNINLGAWVHRQRRLQRQGTLTERYQQRLERLGMKWTRQKDTPSTASWDAMLVLFRQYHTREGHGNVPQRHVEEHENLGKWLSNQRTLKKQGTLDPARRRRLEEIGVVWKINDASRRTPVGWEIMS